MIRICEGVNALLTSRSMRSGVSSTSQTLACGRIVVAIRVLRSVVI
jgi:hypothetical protein